MSADNNKAIESILDEANKSSFIDLWLTDIHGNIKSISLSPSQLKKTEDDLSLLARSFDGSSVLGMTGIADSDLMVAPDSYRFMRFPFKSDHIVLFTEILDWKGLSFIQGDWRQQLKINLDRIEKKLNYEVKISIELEFYLLQLDQQNNFIPLDVKGYFDLATISMKQQLLTLIINDAKQVGVTISRAHHEGAHGQFEIELLADEPLRVADNIIALRHIIRSRAKQNGLNANFMPKPFENQEGCGLHIRMAVFNKEGKNALYEQDNKTLNIAGKSAVVGLCWHSRELMLTTNQWLNSYKRFQPNTDAPVYLYCSEQLRATSFHSGFSLDNDAYTQESAIHITHPDAACNPYLALNALISAALTTQEPEARFEKKFIQHAPVETEVLVYQQFPEDLGQAIDTFESSQLAKDIFGKELCTSLVNLKRKQWEAYQEHVSDWESKHYREVL